MYNQFISNGELDLIKFFQFIISLRNKILRNFIFLVIIFTIFNLIRQESYSASISFYTNYELESQNSSKVLNIFDSNILGGTSSLDFTIEDYIQSDKFLNDIILQTYLIDETKINLVELWGENYNSYFNFNPISTILLLYRNSNFTSVSSINDKKRFHAKKVLSKNMSLLYDDNTGLYTLVLSTKKYPYLAKDIMDNIYKSILNYSNEITNIKANEKVGFVEKQLDEIKLKLDSAENKLINFLENNKSLESPSLIVRKNRLDTEIAVLSQLYISLNDQLELTKIESKNFTTPIFFLDKSTINVMKSGNSLITIHFSLLILSLIMTPIYHIILRRSL